MENCTVSSNPKTLNRAAAGETMPELDPQRLTLALERHRAEFEALGPEQLLHITLDVAAAAMLVLKRWPTWTALMPRIQALPGVNYNSIANLESYAEATLKVNAEYITGAAPPAALAATLADADTLRNALRADAKVLLRRGFLPSGSLNAVRGLSGYRNTAVELTALVTVLEKSWDLIQGKTAITREDLNRGSVLAQYIFRNATDRQTRQPYSIDIARLRQQAFTTLPRAYNELRRCVSFLHPQAGEAERLAPSFYQGRGGRPIQPAKLREPTATALASSEEAQGVEPAPADSELDRHLLAPSNFAIGHS